jgi:3',5'-cyclic AMP phosphodiesterase CpdA
MHSFTRSAWERNTGRSASMPAFQSRNIHASFALLILSLFIFATASASAQTLSHPNAKEVEKLDESSCADGFSFTVMADSHVNTGVFEVMRDAIVKMKPDFAVSVGDTTNNGLDNEYATFLGQIGIAKFPWFVVPGNHEYRSPQGHTSADGPVRFKRIYGKQDFAFAHCGWKFVMIDIVAMEALTPSQLSWLKKQLAGYEGKAAVFMHYPPAVIKNWEQGYWTANGKEFLKILEDFRVPYFFAGHLHVYDRIIIGPTKYIVTGGGGGGVDSETPREKYNSPDGGAFYHFIYVLVKGDKATDFVVRPDYAEPAPAAPPGTNN